MLNEFLEDDLKYCEEQIKEATVMIQASSSPYSKIAIDAWTKYKERWERIKEALEGSRWFDSKTNPEKDEPIEFIVPWYRLSELTSEEHIIGIFDDDGYWDLKEQTVWDDEEVSFWRYIKSVHGKKVDYM